MMISLSRRRMSSGLVTPRLLFMMVATVCSILTHHVSQGFTPPIPGTSSSSPSYSPLLQQVKATFANPASLTRPSPTSHLFMASSSSEDKEKSEEEKERKRPKIKLTEVDADGNVVENPTLSSKDAPQIRLIQLPVEDEKDMPLYSLGVNLAQQIPSNVKMIFDKRELSIIAQGWNDCFNDNMEIDARSMLQTFGNSVNQMLQERTLKLIDDTKKKGADYIQSYLKENPKAIQKASGLVYMEKSPGTDKTKSPTLESVVKVHYHGTLVPDGKVVDSSNKEGGGEPVTISLQQVIPGWKEGLQLMTVGSQATIVCPCELAYGEAGATEQIPPGSTLQFDIELLEIVS